MHCEPVSRTIEHESYGRRDGERAAARARERAGRPDLRRDRGGGRHLGHGQGHVVPVRARGQDCARARGQRPRGKTAYGVAADKAAHLAGKELSKDERKQYGKEIHWALGIGTAALYGVLRPRVPHAGLAHGLAFGAAFWLLVDEGANYALGLTPGPTKFPWQTHARGLAGHLVYGSVTDVTLAALQRAA